MRNIEPRAAQHTCFWICDREVPRAYDRHCKGRMRLSLVASIGLGAAVPIWGVRLQHVPNTRMIIVPAARPT